MKESAKTTEPSPCLTSDDVETDDRNDEIPVVDLEFKYVGIIRGANSVRLLFNRTIEDIESASIRLLNESNADITSVYPFSTAVLGNEIKITFATLPAEAFKVQVLENAIIAEGGEIMITQLITESVSYDSSVIGDGSFEDDTTDLTETLRFSDFALVNEQIWQTMIASLRIGISNGTDTVYERPSILVAMYDSESGKLLALSQEEVNIGIYAEKTIFVDLPLSANMNPNGKYNNGGYYFKAFLWNSTEIMNPLINIPATLYVGGVN